MGVKSNDQINASEVTSLIEDLITLYGHRTLTMTGTYQNSTEIKSRRLSNTAATSRLT